MYSDKKRGSLLRIVPKLFVVVAMVASSLLTTAAVQAQEPADLDLSALLTPDARAHYAEVHDSLGISGPLDSLMGSAINPDDFECSNTPFGEWADELFSDVDPDLLDFLFENFVPQWAGDATALYDDDPSDTYIGINGEYTKEQLKRHRKADRFWDVPTSDVQLHGMHGADIADDTKMLPLLEWGFGVSTEEAQEILDFVQEVIESTIGYDHPLFSFNAFAAPAQVIPGVGPISDKIVMGDGILEGYAAIGLAGTASDFIHAHEFAHHIQFETGVLTPDSVFEPEATRRTELMADALAAYNLAHARGASFQNKRIVEIIEAGSTIGDCGFDNPNHHGTPNQRAAAAEWGANLAHSTKPRGKVISAYDMVELFDAELPSIIAPDAR